jgi:hypothetical protein
MTLASLPGSNPANPQVIVVTPYYTQGPLPNQDSNASSLQNTQTPSVTPLPCNKPKMISETIKDDTSFGPGKTFIKTWTIRNDGICTWDSSYHFIFMGGTQMGGLSSMSLPKVVVPGDTVTLSVSLKAPSTDGAYTGTWVLKSGSGEMFGNYWAKIIVGLPAGPFAVTSIDVNTSPTIIVEKCPFTVSIDCEAYITVNGPGTVTYWFQHGERGDNTPRNPISAISSMTFSAAGSKFVRLPCIINGTRTDTYAYKDFVKVYVDKPNHQVFGGQRVEIDCSQ